MARTASLSLETAAFSRVMTSVAVCLGHVAALCDRRSLVSSLRAEMQNLSRVEAAARHSLVADEATAFVAILLGPRAHPAPSASASFIFAPEQRGRSILRDLEAFCAEGFFVEFEQRTRSALRDLEHKARNLVMNCDYAQRCDVLWEEKVGPGRRERRIFTPEFDGRCLLYVQESKAFVAAVLAARAFPAAPSRAVLTPRQYRTVKSFMRGVDEGVIQQATAIFLTQAAQSAVFAPEEDGRSLLRDLEDFERPSLSLALFHHHTRFLDAEIQNFRATELVENFELRSLLALPVQTPSRAVRPVLGRATQTPKGWSSRTASSRISMAYTPHSSTAGPAPDAPAVLWAMRHSEEFMSIESSGRWRLSQLEKELWKDMFEGHGDIVRHRGAEAARIAESRRQRVEFAGAVANGDALAGLVDTERMQRHFLFFEQDAAWWADVRDRPSRPSDTSMFRRSNVRALETLSYPPIDRMSQCEWFEPFWEPPTLDVADGDFVRWCEEAEELCRAATKREEDDEREALKDAAFGDVSGDDEVGYHLREYESEWTERAENGEPTQESTHAPAHFYNNCGEEFDDCFGEL